MKHVMTILALSVACMAGSALAADAAPANKQQSKMGECNKAAADKKGDERKDFMKSCLSADKPAAEKKQTPQERMKSCNADAKDKKGDERKAFMKDCLSTK